MFVEEVARSAGDKCLARRAAGAVLHLTGMNGLYSGHREDVSRIIDGDDRIVASRLLTDMIRQGGVLAPAAEAVLVELADPEQFWREIREAKALSKTAGIPDIPDDVSGLETDLYDPGPISAIDRPYFI